MNLDITIHQRLPCLSQPHDIIQRGCNSGRRPNLGSLLGVLKEPHFETASKRNSVYDDLDLSGTAVVEAPRQGEV